MNVMSVPGWSPGIQQEIARLVATGNQQMLDSHAVRVHPLARDLAGRFTVRTRHGRRARRTRVGAVRARTHPTAKDERRCVLPNINGRTIRHVRVLEARGQRSVVSKIDKWR